jgi:hypothetical protein
MTVRSVIFNAHSDREHPPRFSVLPFCARNRPPTVGGLLYPEIKRLNDIAEKGGETQVLSADLCLGVVLVVWFVLTECTAQHGVA